MAELGDLLTRDRLNYVVKMRRKAARMRPQAVIDLLRVYQLASDLRSPQQQRPELGGLSGRKVSYGGHVPFRLDYERPKAKGTNAVLDEP